jgi:purine-cytosine permease-like protein
LLAIGVPIKRHIAALFDGAIMLVGSFYLVWIADNFFYPFQGFLITLGVPIATWSAIFVTDVLLRKRPYSEDDLYRASGKYGSWNKRSLSIMAVGTFIGWGFVTNTFASWLSWQGYLLFIIGGREGSWAYSNVGVIFSLLVGFLGHFLFASRKIRTEEG